MSAHQSNPVKRGERPASQATRFIGRQPILDRRESLYAYELLYRTRTPRGEGFDGDVATADVIDYMLNVVGLESLIGNKRAFINFTRNGLVNEDWRLLPSRNVVIEVLEDVEIDDEVIKACRDLHRAGYTLALDDFAYQERIDSLLQIADIVKLDFMADSPAERSAMVLSLNEYNVQLLAEKVETRDDHREAIELGCTYVQGYYFAKPELMSATDLPSVRSTYMQFLIEVNRQPMDFAAVEAIVKCEVSLSYKLLKYLNSAAVGVRHRISSISQALTLLGERPLRRWASMVAISAIAADKPDALLIASLIRGRFCELICQELGLGEQSFDLFLMGMFSTMDAMMDRPIDQILGELPLDDAAAAAIRGADSPMGPALQLAIACEKGDPALVSDLTDMLDVPMSRIAAAHSAAIRWAHQVFER